MTLDHPAFVLVFHDTLGVALSGTNPFVTLMLAILCGAAFLALIPVIGSLLKAKSKLARSENEYQALRRSKMADEVKIDELQKRIDDYDAKLRSDEREVEESRDRVQKLTKEVEELRRLHEAAKQRVASSEQPPQPSKSPPTAAEEEDEDE
jgi:septal ring factor EnvC (AmiA/AmiB activator)